MALPPTSALSQIFITPEAFISTEVPRLAINLEALDKCGKSHYAFLTTPDPIVAVTNDPGTLHIVKKAHQAGRRFNGVMQLNYATPDPAVTRTADVDREEWMAWKKEWARYKSGIYALLNEDPRSPNRTRTLIKDTETDVWTLCMLAHFGKTVKIEQHMRTEANADYSKVYWDLYKGRPDLNMILIHKLKKQYVKNSKGNSDWNGEYETSGMNQVGYHVDFTLKAAWDPQYKSFYTEITKPTRYGAGLAGKRWYGEQSHFGLLALEIFPETILTPQIWGFR